MTVRESTHSSLVRAKTINGRPIHNLDAWYKFAPPKKPKIQWKDFRSAKELARAWLRGSTPEMPVEYSKLLSSLGLTSGFIPEVAIAEVEIRIDQFGGPRNSDLIVFGHSKKQPILLAVEAKADEGFAEPIADELEDLPEASNKPERVDRLVEAVLNRDVDDHVRTLRYQLLHSLAATAIEARNHKAKLGVLLIHEFISLSLDFEKVTTNASDLKAFVRTIPDWENETIVTGRLLHPIMLRGNKHVPGDQPVTIGKVRTLIPLDAEGRRQVPAGYDSKGRQFLVTSPATVVPH